MEAGENSSSLPNPLVNRRTALTTVAKATAMVGAVASGLLPISEGKEALRQIPNNLVILDFAPSSPVSGTSQEDFPNNESFTRSMLKDNYIPRKQFETELFQAQGEVVEMYKKHPEAKTALACQANEQWRDAELRRWRSQKTKEQWTTDFRASRRTAYDRTYLRKSLGLLHSIFQRTG